MNRKTLMIAGALVLFFVTLKPGFAGEGMSGDYLADIGTKIGRGVGNIFTSPLEIPCTMGDDLVVRPAIGIFTGFGKGVLFMARRILIGVCEVGTFMIPAEPTIPPVCKVNSNK